ncbi:Ribokinase-like protein [Mycena floridula]|nr:Ribokinase-like protein [Mycena floridula]
MTRPPKFATLGMFIVDEFLYLDEQGQPTEKRLEAQIGGGGTYAAVGCRIWLAPEQIGMIIDRGSDFEFQSQLEEYGKDMWTFRDQPTGTTRALNSYKGDFREFEYLTPRIRITPLDMRGTKMERAEFLHFICSPSRASEIMAEVQQVEGWHPTTIYEPIPDRCVPEELPALIKILPLVSILSPNAEEALKLLSMSFDNTKPPIEDAAQQLLALNADKGCVIIRSGSLGAFVLTKAGGGRWVDAYWNDAARIVDVTGAGNSFLGGLAAGLILTKGDVYVATAYATVSASFTIEQCGLPRISKTEGGFTKWNDDSPERRLKELQSRT